MLGTSLTLEVDTINTYRTSFLYLYTGPSNAGISQKGDIMRIPGKCRFVGGTSTSIPADIPNHSDIVCQPPRGSKGVKGMLCVRR